VIRISSWVAFLQFGTPALMIPSYVRGLPSADKVLGRLGQGWTRLREWLGTRLGKRLEAETRLVGPPSLVRLWDEWLGL
jgi:hypothetical protein